METQLRNRIRYPLALSIAATACAIAFPAQAVDWGGYFRAGPGATKKDASRACYGLDGPGLKYRLGNECDFYGEFLLSQGFKADGVDYKAHLMTNLWNGATDTGNSKLGIAQMFVEGKGYDFAPTVSFWVGKRYYARHDVHIVDTHYTDLSGVGAGADGISLGGPTLSLAWFRTDAAANQSGNRINADVHGINTNPGGKLRVTGTFTNGAFTGGTGGFGLGLLHSQDNFLGLGGGNNLWFQYAQGSAGLNGNFGNLSAPSSNKSWRVIESLTWQMGPLGGQAQAMFQQDKSTGLKVNSATIGGRVSYAVTKNLKFLAEAGYSQKKPDNSATQKLAKLTVGPALTTGPGFWNRPELRLYVTHAKWNAAANAAAGAGGVTGIGDGKTNGTSYGAQVEMWF